ncbi:MAG: acetyl-CoA carboxylase, biotin carboxyl carrier protein [Holosporales bacterium]|jgi:acetyl-CoA carboxylase biotin carboxyl carrier protein|nr:acetyl-CoA carboxylase, biotin carboxyl carrier protein [Holosporales bacterium]
MKRLLSFFVRRRSAVNEQTFDKLAEILKKHSLAEIEYSRFGTKIRISSVGPRSKMTVGSEDEKQDVVQDAPVKCDDYSKHPGAFKSPMVGICYLSPEPGAKNFVSVGDEVQEGQPILIIEAMKVMNLIKSPKAGRLIHMAISNSMPVEFGQLLAVIE